MPPRGELDQRSQPMRDAKIWSMHADARPPADLDGSRAGGAARARASHVVGGDRRAQPAELPSWRWRLLDTRGELSASRIQSRKRLRRRKNSFIQSRSFLILCHSHGHFITYLLYTVYPDRNARARDYLVIYVRPCSPSCSELPACVCESRSGRGPDTVRSTRTGREYACCGSRSVYARLTPGRRPRADPCKVVARATPRQRSAPRRLGGGGEQRASEFHIWRLSD